MPQTNYAVRLRAPYETLRQTLSDWTSKASKVVAYEHPEEGNVHCHILLMGVHVTEQNLKDIMKRHDVGLKGAGQLSFKTTFKNPDKVIMEINDETSLKFITYMSKGQYDPKYVTGYTDEIIAHCKSQWINYRRKSPDEILYVDFVKYIWEKENEFGVRFTDIKILKSYALQHAKKKYGVINLGCRRDAAMLWTTYAYENRIINEVVLPFDE